MRRLITTLACLVLLTVQGHTIQARAAEFPAVLSQEPPKLLSEYGFFRGSGIADPAPGLRLYDLVTPLFSDSAQKTRHVHVPQGAKALYTQSEAFEFPAGSALVKTFAFPADFREPDKNIRLIETRVLLRQSDGWLALAYVWNDDQSDAELKVAGKRLPVEFIDAAGEKVSFSYAVPNRNQCKGCHSIDGELVPLGPKARNLNKASPVAGETVNQLEGWQAAGIFEGLPALDAVEKAADAGDETLPVEARARTWLDVNCAHCHRLEGPASNSGLFLTSGTKDMVALGVGKRPVAVGRGAGANEFDIVAGHPEQSILLTRVESVEPGVMMPELGRNLPDPFAVELLRTWIAQME
jgi:uncharacterized repeat protein (TIGR03806 family)